MDAVKFVEERNRMCDFYKLRCTSCPLEGKQCTLFRGLDVKYTVAAVEAWSIAHPVKTRQSVFLSHYPDARIDDYGILRLCPMAISAAHRDSSGVCGDPERECYDCRREFWTQEVE